MTLEASMGGPFGTDDPEALVEQTLQVAAGKAIGPENVQEIVPPGTMESLASHSDEMMHALVEAAENNESVLDASYEQGEKIAIEEGLPGFPMTRDEWKQTPPRLFSFALGTMEEAGQELDLNRSTWPEVNVTEAGDFNVTLQGTQGEEGLWEIDREDLEEWHPVKTVMEYLWPVYVLIFVAVFLVIFVALLVVLLAAFTVAEVAGHYAETATTLAATWAQGHKAVLDAFLTTTAATTSAQARAAIAGLDEARNGVADAYERAYDTAENVLLDPDGDQAMTLVEYQWNTIPVEYTGWEADHPITGDSRVDRTVFGPQGPDFPNAPDHEGDGWEDGPEIGYWSNLIDRVLQERIEQKKDRVEQQLPVNKSEVETTIESEVITPIEDAACFQPPGPPADDLQPLPDLEIQNTASDSSCADLEIDPEGAWKEAAWLANNLAPDPCPYVKDALVAAKDAGNAALSVVPEEVQLGGTNYFDPDNSTFTLTPYKTITRDTTDLGFWTADRHVTPNCRDVEFSETPPELPRTASGIVANLNSLTGLAWRHPGFFLDTDGDGYINVHDPDSDNDRLLDGHTITVDRDDPRYECYGRSHAEDPCPPYDSHPLVHDSGFWENVYPGELTLHSYPGFADSDCQATLPGDTTPSRCSSSNEAGREGTPGHGDQLNDSAEYKYWSSLKQDDRYAAFHPNATNASHPAEPWNTSYDWDPVNETLLDADSDDDGLLDGEEVRGCRMDEGSCEGDVTSTAAWTDDTDGDGLSDGEESDWGTDPTSWDTDGDELPDGWEAWYGLDPTTPEATGDPDGDGLSNRDEYCMGADEMPTVTSLCGDEDAPGWEANWCGSNPQVADTDEDGVGDGSDTNTTYDCTAPSAIGGLDSRAVAPYDEPNQDLGTLDPESEEWLGTGQYAEKAAAHPVNFTNRTLADPVKIAREIRENLTEDTETLTRLVAPPIVRHETWRGRQQTASAVESLHACPAPVDTRKEIVRIPTFNLEEEVKRVKERADRPRATTDCMTDWLQRRVDDASEVDPTSLVTQPADTITQLVRNASEPPVTTPEPIERVTTTLPTRDPLSVPEAALETANATAGALEDQALEPVATEPWSLVSEPDRFPNLLSDLAGNRHTPDGLYETVVTADQAAGTDTQLAATADATTWDLVVGFPDNTTQHIQNIPVGTPRPVNLYEDCVPNPANTSQVENVTGCAHRFADPDLTVELEPLTSGATPDGYAFTTDTHTPNLNLSLSGRIQVPNRQRALTLDLDARPEAAENLSSSVSTGSLPDQFRYTVQSNATGTQRLDITLEQTGADGPLVVTGGFFAVDPHDPDKPIQPSPRTEASALLHAPPTQLSLQTARTMENDRSQLEATWTSTQPTQVTASFLSVSATRELSGLLTADRLPTQGTVQVTDGDTRTRVHIDTSDAGGDPLDRVALHGVLQDSTTNAGPTVLDINVTDPPQQANLLVNEAPTGADARVDYQASSAFQHANVSVFRAGQACPVIPADNLIVVQDACAHLNLTGLEQASVTVADRDLTANWGRSTGQGNLSIRATIQGTNADALVDPWPKTGEVTAAWPQPMTTEWQLSSGLDRLIADVETSSGTEGLLAVEGLPPDGNVDIDPGQRRLSTDPSASIDRVQARLTTDGQLPDAPSTGDYVLVDRPDTDTLRARVDLHDLGDNDVNLASEETTLDLHTSAGRDLTVHVDTPDASARVHVDQMPPALFTELAQSGSNTTVIVDHTGASRPAIDASGRLEGMGFDVAIPALPRSVSGFVDTASGNLGLDASSPLTVNATVTGNPDTAPPVIPLQGIAPGVSMALEETLEGQETGLRIDLEKIEHAHLHRSRDSDTGQSRFEGEIRAEDPTPLTVASVDNSARHFAMIENVPADTNFTAAFNDGGGAFDYEASHTIDRVRVASITPATFFHGWAQDVPKRINATWAQPEDLTSGTLTGRLNHSSTTPLPEVGFKWVNDTQSSLRTAKSLVAENVSSPTEVELEDRHNLTLDLGATDHADRLVALFADGMPTDRVTFPESGTQGVHYQAVSGDRQSFAVRLGGVDSIRNARIPTDTQPDLNVATTLHDATPFDLFIEDGSRNLLADVDVGQLGGGPVDLDGRLALAGDPAEAYVDANLSQPLVDASLHYRNATAWFAGNATTQATDLDLELAPPRVYLDADRPATVQVRGAPREQDAPAGSTSESFARVDLRSAAPLVHARGEGIEHLDFSPNATGVAEADGYLNWTSEIAQSFNASFVNETWTLEEVNVTPLPQYGNVTWDTSSGLSGTFDLSSGVDRVRLDLMHNPENGVSTQVDATLLDVGGDGSVTFDPDRKASLDVPEGIGDVRGEVFRNVSQPQHLTALEDTLGLVFDSPPDGSALQYGKAVAVNLTDATGLDATLATPETGGVKAQGTLSLEQSTTDELHLRANTESGLLDARTSNLPAETDFRVDTRNVTGPDGEKVPFKVDFDWGTRTVDNVDGTFRAYGDADQEDKGEDGRGTPEDLQGNFTVRNLSNVTVAKQGRFNETVRGHVGGELDRVNVRVDDQGNRTRVEASGVDGVYDITLTDKGRRAGEVDLRPGGEPADHVSLEAKEPDVTTVNPDDKKFLGDYSQWLIATLDGDDKNYTHVQLQDPVHADWNSSDSTGLTGRVERFGVDEPTLVRFRNGTQSVNATIPDLPTETSFTFRDTPNETTIGLGSNDPMNVPLVTYRNLTDASEGVEAQNGDPVNLAITGKRIQNLENTTITIQSNGSDSGTVTVDSGGLEFARLFGVFRGNGSQSGEGKHVFSELQGVPNTTATFTYNVSSTPPGADEDRPPFIALDSTEPLERTTVSFVSPVTREPATRTYPNTTHSEYLSVETRANETVSGAEQTVAQANLTGIETASLDPTTSLDACPDCSPITFSLDRGLTEHPIFVNVNASMSPVTGTVSAPEAPDRLRLGFATDTTTVQTEDGVKDVTTDVAAEYDASGPIRDLDVDLAADINGTETRFNGSVDEFPSQASVEYTRDPQTIDDPESACGLPLTEKLPGRIDVASHVSKPVRGLNLSIRPAGAGQGPLDPGQAGNYLGLQRGDEAWNVRVLFERLDDVSLTADPAAEGTPIFYARANLTQPGDLSFDYIDPAESHEDQQADRIIHGSIEGFEGPIHAQCDGERLQLWPGTQSTVDATQWIDHARVEGANVEMMDRTATAFVADVTKLGGGVSLDLGVLDQDNEPIEGKHGFAVHAMHDDAQVQDLTFDVDWDPSSVEPPAQCPGGSGTPGTTEETLIEWSLPVDHAEVALTTQRPFSHPSTSNWVKRTSTCDQDTLALELHDLEDVRFKRSPTEDPCDPLTELWINTTQARNTDLKTEGISCEDGSQTGKRVKIHPLPTTFWIKTPVPPWYPLVDKGAVYRSSATIDLFEQIDTVHGCTMLHTEGVDPASNANQIVGFTDAYGEGLSCKAQGTAQDVASAAGQYIQRGFDSVKRTVAKAAQAGQRGVECTVYDMVSDVDIAWDTDGYSDQRDRPRFHEVGATVEHLECWTRSRDDDQGSLLDIPNFPGGRTDVDLQSQWWPSGGRAPVDSNIPGSLDIPDSWLTESRCLKWNATNSSHCLDWESTREIHERIAENYTVNAGRVFEDHEEYAVPWREWADALT